MNTFRTHTVYAAALVVTLCLPSFVSAQLLEETGAVATGLLLRQLDGVKRVLMIAAHPDDEDTSFLTALSRGWGAETAYLALTRGDGGQNLIGPELWEGLGIVRTGELVSARRLDGGKQFFTRAFDYGYSKSADEALTLWPRDEILADVVWVVRKYRPQVVVSVFSGTPADGHGQHQAAGIMAREAFAAAGDPTRFPEQLAMGVEPWTPSKLYQTSRRRFFNPTAEVEEGAIDVETGLRDPLIGRSFHQLAMESRSQHRSQDMGAPQPPGPRRTSVVLVESRVDGDGSIFAGVDTTLAGLTAALPGDAGASARRHLEMYRGAIDGARSSFGLDPETVTPHLVEARRHLGAAREAAMAVHQDLDARMTRLDQAIMASSGISFELRSADDLVVPGQSVEVIAHLWNGGSRSLSRPEPRMSLPEGWRVTERGVEGLGSDGAVPPGGLATWSYEVVVPRDADSSRLYYLRQPRLGAMYSWPDDPDLWGLPRDPADVSATVSFGLVGDGVPQPQNVEAEAEWRYVGVDPARGQFQHPVLVVPALSVEVSPAGVTWPQSKAGAQFISVRVKAEGESGASGRITVSPPDAWTVTPRSQDFSLDASGAERVMTFQIEPAGSLRAGRQVFGVVATTEDGGTYDEGYALVDYEHIERTALFAPAEASVVVVPVAVPDDLRVGYIMGSGDDGPEAIRQMGVEVEILDEAQVRAGDFGRFGTIVLGVRAYETRADLQAAAAQLLDFARQGGTVVVQYNRGPLGRLAPYEMTVGRGSPRVADETAPVTILDPSAPLFTSPNRITAADFEGWVQERGLYFASEWDEAYQPLLELNDPGEPPRRGALLVAPVGEGVFVYSALSFFRQWAAQVPGAYRLFANLISLDAEAWSSFAGSR
ncbi:MAG: PIG-L family deacetylase [Gemmatimonadetes bacterium]|nr:PIG-L family deacetylase [Gemmatimonadota bacterium]NNL29941.1 PIG-L family deacetylase [Gemmatimonadota bacterium]